MSSSQAVQQDAPQWHAWDSQEVLTRLETDHNGLTEQEAVDRLGQYGRNELEPEKPVSNWTILFGQFKSPLIYILIVAAVITAAIGEFIDTAVIVAVLVLNTTVGFTQERQANQSVRALMRLAGQQSLVIRDGQQLRIDSTGLVQGDVVLLESGSRVPADLRVLDATGLLVDESMLTGESVPATKRTDAVAPEALAADRWSVAHMGSLVASGRGRGVVVSTGVHTELGAISERIRSESQPESPLTRRMARFGNIIALLVTGAAVLTFLVGLGLGEPANQMFLTAVAMAVAAVPEGLPIALTVAMALGVRRMARRNAIIRNLPAVETLGSTNTIGSDKTGTLTENQMTVQAIWAAGSSYEWTSSDDPSHLEQLRTHVETESALSLALSAGVFTNEAQLSEEDSNGVEVSGDPTEAALLRSAVDLGQDPRTLRSEHEVVAEVPFESDLRYSLSVRDHGDRRRMWLKGAPERVLELATNMVGPDGDVRQLDRDQVQVAAEQMADQGLRVLAMAYRDLDPAEAVPEPPEPEQLVFAGLQGMLDPPRDGVREAIYGCLQAGMRVLMITGDHAGTARAIAADLGIITDDHDRVVTGQQIEKADDAELDRLVTEVPVYARMSPDHKFRVVKALRRHGEITAVTGDGVNDGPALRAAHIGVAMGRDGTDVAREASDMVLTDDNFVSIYHAVREGRVVFDNVRKVTYYLLSTGVAAIAALLYSLVAGLPLPLLPAQLLWLNVVTSGLQDVALAFEPGECNVLGRPPRGRDDPVVSPRLWERTIFTGLTMAVGAMVLFINALDDGQSVTYARTVALTTLVLFMAFHAYNARSEHRSVFRISPVSNRFLLSATAGAFTIHVLAMYWYPTQLLLRIQPVDGRTWMYMVAVAASVVVVSELHKLLRNEEPH